MTGQGGVRAASNAPSVRRASRLALALAVGALLGVPLPAEAAGGGVSMRVTGCQSGVVSLPAFRGSGTQTDLYVTGHWAIAGLFDPRQPADRNVAFGYLRSIIRPVGVGIGWSFDAWPAGTAWLVLCTDAPGWIRVSIKTMHHWVTVRPTGRPQGGYLTLATSPIGPVDPTILRHTIPQTRTMAVVMGARFEHKMAKTHAVMCVRPPSALPCDVAEPVSKQPSPVYWSDDDSDFISGGVYDRTEYPGCTQAELDVAAAGSAGPGRLDIGYVAFS